MKKYILCCMALLLLVTVNAQAQDTYNDRVKKYIDQYSKLAIEEQRRNGIPASITLGQGILETEAGASELMTVANNHFGIKCGNNWMGETFSHTDDAPDECFKKYKCVEDSYKDHSDHLKRNPRYAPLFTLSQTDYASWAVCLKKCGYATNPQYAQKLIKIIEDFKLQEYTYSALSDASLNDYPAAPAPVLNTSDAGPAEDDDTDKKTVIIADTIAAAKQETAATPIGKIADSARDVINHLQPAAPQAGGDAAAIANNFQNSKLVTVNGLKAFYAYKHEMLLQYAVKFNVHYPKLLEFNDLPDAPLPFDTYVYVEKKLGAGKHSQHAVKDGETLLMIAQAEGVQLKRLMALNLLKPGEEPATGSVIELQFQARQKPALRGNKAAAQGNAAAPVSDSAGPGHAPVMVRSKGRQPLIPTAVSDTGNTPPDVTPPAAVTTPPPAKTTPAVSSAPAAPQPAASANKPPKPPADPEADLSQEDLAALKAQLDKVVYADDSKLPSKNVVAAPPPKAPAALPAKNEAAAAPQKKPAELPVKNEVAAPPQKKPVTEAATGKEATKHYTVKRGDTAFSIAKRNNITLDQLMEWNHIDGGVKAGQSLRVK